MKRIWVRAWRVCKGGCLDFRKELHKLHGEVLKTYGELVQTVMHQPERYARLTEHIGVVIRNMLQLVNLMRPYQVLLSLWTNCRSLFRAWHP